MRRLLPLALVSLLAGGLAGAAAPPLFHLVLGVTTPNMGLVLPQPGVTPGPTWASQLVTALQAVDSHDHTPGHGAQIPTMAISPGDIHSEGFAVRASEFDFDSTAAGLYTQGGELWFQDASSNDVQITSAGALYVGASRGINGQYSTDPAHPSALWTTSTKRYSLTRDGSTPGGLSVGAFFPTSKAVSASTTVSDTDTTTVLLVNPSGAPRTVTLPLAVNNTGRILVIKDSGGAAFTYPVTVTNGVDNIDGVTSRAINTNYGLLRLVSGGSAGWFTW